jgi:hypothetical protein
MKASIRSLLLLILFGGCATAPPVIQEHMVISPSSFIFQAPDSATTVSITHTCTCPFTWTSSLRRSVPWLTLGQNFPASMTGDHASIPLTIDRSKLTQPRDSTVIAIASNSYGVDSITVLGLK